MMTLLGADGASIAVGLSVLFVVAGLIMHRVFVHILKKGSSKPITYD